MRSKGDKMASLVHSTYTNNLRKN